MIVELLNQHAARLTEVGLHFLWQGTAIAILAALLSRFLIKAPRHRSAIHLLGLIALALCVPATWIALKETPAATAFQPALSQPFPQEMASPLALESTSPIPPTPQPLPLSVWIVGLYFTGLFLMLLRVLQGYRWSHQIRKTGKPVTEAPWIDALTQALASMSLRTKATMLWSQKVTSPVLTGILRPMIILPVSLMSGLPREQAIAILSHELAHLRRFDHLIVVFQRLLEALFFFHPAVWFLSRRLDQEREKACDDLVVKAGHNRADYAEALIKLASDQAPTLALAASKNSHLKERIFRILNHPQPTTVQVNRSGWLTIAAAIAALGFLSLSPALSDEKEIAQDELGESPEDGATDCSLPKLELKIPQIDFNQTTLEEAIEFLRLRSVDLDPEGNGISFVIRTPKGEHPDPNSIIIDRLVARDFTIGDALNAICKKTKMKYRIDEFAIVLLPLTDAEIAGQIDPDEIIQRSWKTSENFINFITPKAAEDRPVIIKPLMEALGVEFPQGSEIRYLPETQTLIANNTPENLELIDAIFTASGSGEEDVKPDNQKVIPAVIPDGILNELIIPNVTFTDATLAEAIEFLRMRAQELDPAKKGVNINIFSDEKDLSQAVIKSLELKNVPLRVVILYLCDATKTRYLVEGRNISILPAKK